MAASSLNTIRVRLYFDYPPPGVSDCRMCWVLVDLNKCRVVADLASVIKEKFDFSRRTILNLFMDDCFLPPTESVYVVRDNDSIRVKVENQQQENGFAVNRKSEDLSRKANKRVREEDDENEAVKIKKKKKPQLESQEVDLQPVRDGEKKKKKKKKLKEKNLSVKPASPVKRTTPVKEVAVSKSGAAKSAKKPAAPTTSAPSKAAKQKASSSSDTSGSSEERPLTKKSQLVVMTNFFSRPRGGVPAAAKAGVTAAPSSSSGSSSDSAPGPAATKLVPKKPAPPKPSPTKPAPPKMDFQATLAKASLSKPAPTGAVVRTGANSRGFRGSSSDSSSDSEPVLANKRPGLGCQVPPLATGPSDILPAAGVTGRGGGRGWGCSPGRGMGRGEGRFPWRGGGGPRGGQRGGPGFGGRGMGNPQPHSDQNGLQQHRSDTLTNKAVVLRNPPPRALERDYASMPLLAAPPQVGQRIAFKLLELTENYTPEVSDYKEGKIIGIDLVTNQVELELLSSAPAPAEPGKFDLVYQNADGSEIVEYAVPRASQLKERWDSLLEPRLIVENA
ncbi:coilin [Conger conger]|uniref:coilin n=1 Tax=Conger conger TaxID=82655 RepID=UPI002A59FDBC|nr:coilin [Conger conger]